VINTAYMTTTTIRVDTFQSTSNSLTFPDTSSYIYTALQTARNIIDTNGNIKAQLIQQRKWHL